MFVDVVFLVRRPHVTELFDALGSLRGAGSDFPARFSRVVAGWARRHRLGATWARELIERRLLMIPALMADPELLPLYQEECRQQQSFAAVTAALTGAKSPSLADVRASTRREFQKAVPAFRLFFGAEEIKRLRRLARMQIVAVPARPELAFACHLLALQHVGQQSWQSLGRVYQTRLRRQLDPSVATSAAREVVLELRTFIGLKARPPRPGGRPRRANPRR